MKEAVSKAFKVEMDKACRLIDDGALDAACIHLERAHVLGQQYLMPHVRAHWHMLRIGIKRRAPAQVWGQTLRIFLGALGSSIGVVPIGNTGGTNISMFQRLPIEPEIQAILSEKQDERKIE